jgi:hypothetical protein
VSDQEHRFTGLLRKPIRLDEARARNLRAAFAVPPDESDIIHHVQNEMLARWAEFDRLFGLAGKGGNIWEHRAKALIADMLNVPAVDPNLWRKLAERLARAHVPGFSVEKKKQGAPTKWTDDLLAQLFADVSYLKRKNSISAFAACKI